MSRWTVHCWSCATRMEFEIKPGRSAECTNCFADVRACRNCTFYDDAVSNQCREPTADFVSNKERGNFCGMFEPREGEGAQASSAADDARAKLEALFKK